MEEVEESGGLSDFIIQGAGWSMIDGTGRYAAGASGLAGKLPLLYSGNSVIPYTHVLNGTIGYAASGLDGITNLANLASKPFTKMKGFLPEGGPGFKKAWNGFSEGLEGKLKFGNFEYISSTGAATRNAAAKAAGQKGVNYIGGIGITAKLAENGLARKAFTGLALGASTGNVLMTLDMVKIANDVVVDIEQSGKLNRSKLNERIDHSNIHIGTPQITQPSNTRAELQYLLRNNNIASGVLNSTFGG